MLVIAGKSGFHKLYGWLYFNLQMCKGGGGLWTSEHTPFSTRAPSSPCALASLHFSKVQGKKCVNPRFVNAKARMEVDRADAQ